MVEPRDGLGQFAAEAQVLRGLVLSPESRHVPRLPVGQREVLHHVLQGLRNKQIADAMNIDERSVTRHRTDFMNTLGVCSVAEFVQLAVEAGLC